MDKVKLIKVTNENDHLKNSLDVTKEQREDNLILSVSDSLEIAKQNFEKARPFFIEINNEIIGFTMFAFDDEIENPNDRYWLWQFMIDKNEQGKGYGLLALEVIIDYFKNQSVECITLSTKPENKNAIHLYEKAGFKETGEWNNEEVIFQLKI